MNWTNFEIVKAVHGFVLLFGFVIGFGLIDQSRSEFSDLVSNFMTYTESDPVADKSPERMPPPSTFIPKTVAILPKTDNKWNKH